MHMAKMLGYVAEGELNERFAVREQLMMTVYSAKKRARNAQIQEVVFDDEARREYLTGFRKRKLQRKEAKRKNAQERERLERLELRKQHRRELAERAANNAREVEAAFGVFPEDAATDTEVSNPEVAPQEKELEFEDEEQLAVVTVVEDFAADSLRHPEPQQSVADRKSASPQLEKAHLSRVNGSNSQSAKGSQTKLKLKTRPKKVRFETKAAEKAEKRRQRARRTEKAERAGGKKRRGAKR